MISFILQQKNGTPILHVYAQTAYKIRITKRIESVLMEEIIYDFLTME